jgi:hypothetical protein
MPQSSAKSASRVANVSIVIANVLGAAAYLWFSVPLWAPKELANIPGAGAGDPLIWVLTALPILGLFLLLNISWLAWASIVYFVRRNWRIKLIYSIVPVLWAITLYVDFSHHWAM